MPWPHSQIRVAEEPTSAAAAATTGRDASINAASLAAAGPVGSTAGLPVRSCGGTHSASPSAAGTTQTLDEALGGQPQGGQPQPRDPVEAILEELLGGGN